MDHDALIAGLVTVGVGALSGGITNAVAVWMLFHPHEPVRFGPVSLHGAIPKNKARLAKSVGRTVGERLLTPEDLSRRLSDPALRAAFDRAIHHGVTRLLNQEHGTLKETLGPRALAAIDTALPTLATRLGEGVREWVDGPEFPALARRLVTRLADEMGDRALGSALDPGDRSRLKARLELWADDVLGSDALEEAVRRFVATRLERFSDDATPLIDQLPSGVTPAVEQAATDLVPALIERIGEALQDPALRQDVQGVVRDGIDRALRDLVLHQRILAKLVVTDEAIGRLINSFAREGADRLASELRSGAMQQRLREGIAQGLAQALRVPLGTRLARLGADRRAALAQSLGDVAVGILRHAGTREILARAVDQLFVEADRRTWADLLRAIPPEAAARIVADLVKSPAGQRWLEDGVQQASRAILERPIGRPSDWLGRDMSEELAREASDAAWNWVMAQVPDLIGHLQVQEMVEQKVLGFSTQRMEEIVRTVTQRELDLIVRLGYWLGGLVGALAFLVNLALR